MFNTESVREFKAPRYASGNRDRLQGQADAIDRFGSERRAIAHGDMRWLVLDLIQARPRHGYDIIKAIRIALDGRYSPSSGHIYPTLSMLQATGLITRADVGSKKVYSVTKAGADELAAHQETVSQVRERVEALRANFRPMPFLVTRALSELRRALTGRLLDRSLSDEAIDAIAAALEGATIAIGGGMRGSPGTRRDPRSNISGSHGLPPDDEIPSCASRRDTIGKKGNQDG